MATHNDFSDHDDAHGDPSRPLSPNLVAHGTSSSNRQSSLGPREGKRLLPRHSLEVFTGTQTHLPSSNDADHTANPSVVILHKSSYIVLMVFIYASLALTAWILICITTYKPLTANNYGSFSRHPVTHPILDIYGAKSLKAKYAKSEDIYRAARFVQAMISVTTIPLTSAVCSAAAVVYAQSRRRGRQLTMRQMMTLADKGWTDPTTIAKLLAGRGKQLSSSLLAYALLLNVLGASITPLQTVFLSQRTIKIPTGVGNSTSVVDVPIKLTKVREQGYSRTMSTLLTRNALKSTTNTTPQPHLWHESTGCSSSDRSLERCVYETATLANISQLSEPYMAQLPIGYHTGLVKQFATRINSTVKWEAISRETMPTDCGEMPDSFYVHYANATLDLNSKLGPSKSYGGNWSIEACMPGNLSEPPLKRVYGRQDFTETLYLNVSVVGYPEQGYPTGEFDSPLSGGMFRITSQTTAGYFELPNYMNGGIAGPLITGDPDDSIHCDVNCIAQTARYSGKVDPGGVYARTVPPASDFESNESFNLAMVPNKGPLFTVAEALFGFDSFIAARLEHSERFIDAGPSESTRDVCVDQEPLSSLLLDPTLNEPPTCITNTIYDDAHLDLSIANYLRSLYLPGISSKQNPERSTNVFAAAVFLATDVWITSDLDLVGIDLLRYVHNDAGNDMVIPTISPAAMIVISSLWIIYVACLFGLAIYSAKTPRWTYSLDAFAMMRIGAAANERIALDVGFEKKTIEVLDEMPGIIGDATGGEGEIGVLGMGASTPLNDFRYYKCYKGDEDAMKEAEWEVSYQRLQMRKRRRKRRAEKSAVKMLQEQPTGPSEVGGIV